jgi:hypothetical protein
MCVFIKVAQIYELNCNGNSKNQWQFQNSISIHFTTKNQRILITFMERESPAKTSSNPYYTKKTIS